MRAFRSELIRIRRPAFLFGGIGLMAVFAGVVSIFIFTSAERAPAAPKAGQGAGAYTVAGIASPGGFLTALPTVSRLAGVILLALWAIAVATDYSTGLIRILAQAHPNRTRLLGGKIAALSVFTIVATTVTTLVVVVFARPLAKLEGIPIEAWKTDFASHLGKDFFDFTIAGLVWGLIGLMLAVLTRSSAIAIGIGLGFLLVAEGLISIVAPSSSAYLPGARWKRSLPGETTNSPGVRHSGWSSSTASSPPLSPLRCSAPATSPPDLQKAHRSFRYTG
jgi:ABC-type transport system involved in multi-copper enzyme maturation permease subunit